MPVTPGKYIAFTAGDLQEAAAVTVGGVGSANAIAALNSQGQFDPTMIPGGVDLETIVASESLAGGAWVNLWNNAGTLSARNADASAVNGGKRAHGYVLTAVASAGSAVVYFFGRNTACTGLTAGARQFLSGSTPGASTTTPPSTSGYVVQSLGIAISTTEVNAQINPEPVILA